MDFMQNQNKLVMPTNVNTDRFRDRKVVFYGRVSTEHEAQLSALENQLQWYDDQAKYHKNWEVLRKYIDEGITGTQAKKRPAFMEMIADAKKHMFDLIVTREVCRFARNTVDTLVVTRELKEYGVEVYFVEDNIWTMDGDGELRLSLMATLAQEESRKTSERVRAGQKISRDNGVLYGNGNIIGYDRDKVKGTYVINPEQAETVRIIFDLYSKGYGEKRIVNELTRLKRKDGVGKVSWECSKVGRILRNATYKGYKCYLKSYCNNYLDQKRIKNLDESTYLYIKGDFEPIVSEELWDYCAELRKKKTQHMRREDGTMRPFGVKQTNDVFLHKARCSCGSKLRKNRWHQRKDGSWSYGYRCYRVLNNGSKKMREQSGLDTEGYCDGSMICDWKFEIMAAHIFRDLWVNRQEAVIKALEIYNRNFQAESTITKEEIAGIEGKINRAKNKLVNLINMRAEGEIGKDEYLMLRKQTESEIEKLQLDLTKATPSDTIETRKVIDVSKVKARLQELSEYEGGKVPPQLIEKFVATIIVDSPTHFSWFLMLDEGEYHQSFCTLEGRKNTLRLDVRTVEDDGVLPTFFHNQYFTEIDSIAKNTYQSGVLHKRISRTPANKAKKPNGVAKVNNKQ